MKRLIQFTWRQKGFFAVASVVILFYLALYLIYLFESTDVSILQSHYPVSRGKVGKRIQYVLVPEKPITWRGLGEISPDAAHAIVVSEDWAFFYHSGVDLNQLENIFYEFVRELKISRGGSTITQQVVKNLFLTPEKTIWRKVKEIVITKKVEKKITKNKILEVYLNIIELGKGIYGIENASLHYFKKSASQLNAREGAFLAMLLPNPVKYSSSYYNKKLSEYASEKIDQILVKMRQAKFLTEKERLKVVNKKFTWEAQAMEDDEAQTMLWNSN
jgi:monofunctional biosynthetic peptidoglycan transglycosylase